MSLELIAGLVVGGGVFLGAIVLTFRFAVKRAEKSGYKRGAADYEARLTAYANALKERRRHDERKDEFDDGAGFFGRGPGRVRHPGPPDSSD